MITIFNETYPNQFDIYCPSITLPLQAIAWILKTRYRFTLPLKDSGLKGLGFKSVVKGEKLGMVVGVDSWTLFN